MIKPIVEKIDTIKEIPADSVAAPGQVTDSVVTDNITDSQAFIGNIGAGSDDNRHSRNVDSCCGFGFSDVPVFCISI